MATFIINILRGKNVGPAQSGCESELKDTARGKTLGRAAGDSGRGAHGNLGLRPQPTLPAAARTELCRVGGLSLLNTVCVDPLTGSLPRVKGMPRVPGPVIYQPVLQTLLVPGERPFS